MGTKRKAPEAENAITLVRAKLETRHFSFEAYGATKLEAERALADGWKNNHQKNYPGAFDFYDMQLDLEIQYMEIEVGKAYRDGEEL